MQTLTGEQVTLTDFVGKLATAPRPIIGITMTPGRAASLRREAGDLKQTIYLIHSIVHQEADVWVFWDRKVLQAWLQEKIDERWLREYASADKERQKEMVEGLTVQSPESKV